MKQQWDLSSLYQGFNSREFMADSAAMVRVSHELNEAGAHLSGSGNPQQAIQNWLEKLENFERLYQRLFSYASFRFSAATNDGEASRSLTRFREVYTSTARSRVAFAAFLETPPARALVEQGAFGPYTYYLTDLLRRQAHALSPEEESMLSCLALTGSQSWAALHTRMIAAGNHTIHTAQVSAAALNAIKGEVLTVCTLRGYSSPLEEALENYHFDPRVLTRQMEAVERYLPRLRQYFRLKAQVRGLKNGLPYDDRESLILHSGLDFSLEEAKATILDAFQAFSPRMRAFGEAFFDRGWIDSEPRSFKETGASCDAVWAAQESRIRLYYTGGVGSANTLAHELGHGYHFHNLFSQPILNCRYDLPVAEVASKFSEMLFQEQLRKSLPEEERLFCEEFFLSSCINTIVDISARFYFEEAFFAQRKTSQLSVEEIDHLMAQAQRRSYGDVLDPTCPNTRTWMTKPHYYSAQRSFYNFPYQFGTLLALQMLERWKRDPEVFAERYDRFLSSTGRYNVLDLCALLDMDLLAPTFFEEPLRSLSQRLERFCQDMEASIL